MAKLNIEALVSSLDDQSAASIQKRFFDEYAMFVSEKDNPLAFAMLQVMAQQQVQKTLAKNDLALILSHVISENYKDYRWQPKYCDMILKSLTSLKTKAHTDERAERYFKYLQGTVMADFKKAMTAAKDVLPEDELWKPLIDFYKIAAALYAYYALDVSSFTMNVSYDMLENLKNSIKPSQGTVGHDNILQGAQKAISSIGDYSPADRQYGVFMSWMLTEKICRQEGLIQEENA